MQCVEKVLEPPEEELQFKEVRYSFSFFYFVGMVVDDGAANARRGTTRTNQGVRR